MNKKEKISELEEKFHAEVCDLNEKYDKKISELKAELEQEEQEWKPDMGEEYWFVDLEEMEIFINHWADDCIDNRRRESKRIFKTKAEAEEYLEYLKAKEKAMNEFSKEEWEDRNINKYYIQYDYEGKKFKIEYNFRVRKINTLFFRTEESAQEFINKYEKYLRRELGV